MALRIILPQIMIKSLFFVVSIMTFLSFDSFLTLCVYLVVAYGCGSIPFGVLWTRWLKKGDPRTVGSGNIGTTNVYRLAGIKVSALVYLSDFLKSALPLYCAPQEYQLPMGVACIVGHIFPIFLKFKGGKGVAPACGVMAITMPINFIGAALIWGAIFKTTGYMSLACLCGMLGAFVLTALFFDLSATVAMALIMALIVYAHRENIIRLMRGTESSLKKQSVKP
jgi:glycerol-3-phosphate acyltransferase PlsY